MFDESENAIRYKWDPQTCTGFKLRFDAEGAAKGGHLCFHVEDWNWHTVTTEWSCRSLDEALVVLGRFFDIDRNKELQRIQAWLPVAYDTAA